MGGEGAFLAKAHWPKQKSKDHLEKLKISIYSLKNNQRNSKEILKAQNTCKYFKLITLANKLQIVT
jgi:hypothetical protein